MSNIQMGLGIAFTAAAVPLACNKLSLEDMGKGLLHLSSQLTDKVSNLGEIIQTQVHSVSDSIAQTVTKSADNLSELGTRIAETSNTVLLTGVEVSQIVINMCLENPVAFGTGAVGIALVSHSVDMLSNKSQETSMKKIAKHALIGIAAAATLVTLANSDGSANKIVQWFPNHMRFRNDEDVLNLSIYRSFSPADRENSSLNEKISQIPRHIDVSKLMHSPLANLLLSAGAVYAVKKTCDYRKSEILKNAGSN